MVNAKRCRLTLAGVYDGMPVRFSMRTRHGIPGCLRLPRDGRLYLCQDVMNGHPIFDNDFRGFRYSWCLAGFAPMSALLSDIMLDYGFFDVYADVGERCPKRKTQVR